MKNNNPWDQVPIVADDDVTTWIELGESGWHALIGWVAGADRLRRIPDELRRHTVTSSRQTADGDIRQSTEPRTPHDQAAIDADINGYLADAGVPPRPGGFRWFLLPPPGVGEDELAAAFTRGVDELAPAARHPSEIVEPFRRIIDQIYTA